MTHIFISYSHSDADTMRQVREALSGAGLDVWTDHNLTPGTQSWKNAIERAIEEAAALVVLLSPDAKQSDSVERELDYAATFELPIFPVLVRGDKRSSVPFELVTTQWLDARENLAEALHTLANSLRIQLGLGSAETASEPDAVEANDELKVMQVQFAQAVAESKWNVVIELGTELLQLLPEDQEIRRTMGRVYWQYAGSLQLGEDGFEDNPYKQEMALFYFDKAISLQPDQADYYFSRGMLKKRHGDLDDAAADFQQAANMGHARAKSQLMKLRQQE